MGRPAKAGPGHGIEILLDNRGVESSKVPLLPTAARSNLVFTAMAKLARPPATSCAWIAGSDIISLSKRGYISFNMKSL